MNRWGKRTYRVTQHGIESQPSPKGLIRWNQDVEELRASRHAERRLVVDHRPQALPDERLVETFDLNFSLFEVARVGYRLIGVDWRDDSCLVWEMPGFRKEDAVTLARALVEGYA
ncbi:MAG TPA: hypothetical protein VL687_06745 [Methylomirabilota bacterium]|jgi:hypothetical protein|nr:hypothetical protein [Methylomirabilota bacterium]